MWTEAVEGIRILHIGDGKNEFDADFVGRLDDALRAVEEDPDATALITTAAGKHYSNGFDLEFLGRLEMDELMAFMDRTSRALGRLLVFPIPTMCALNGHAFGIGALLALAHDQRVQNAERGWFCLPEVDLRMRFNPFQLAIVTGKLSRPTANEAVLSGKRYDGPASVAAGIAEAAVPPEALVHVAVERVGPRLGKDRTIVATLKRDLHARILGQLPPG
jgi:enoyl-CoA hydratase/carnithine racemase